jgi:hypothetical protein
MTMIVWKEEDIPSIPFQDGLVEEATMLLQRQSGFRLVLGFLRSHICKTYLSLAIRPEIHHHAHDVIDGRIGTLVQQRRGQDGHWKDHQSSFNTTVDSGSSNKTKRPFPSKHDDTKDDVDYLKRGDGFDGSIEVLGEEIPEDLGPEDAVNTGYELPWKIC